MSAPVFQRRGNGLDRPRYFDRQLLIADDLLLEQGFADRRLALLVRHTVGWGVAAGFRLSTQPLSPAEGIVDLVVSTGYALTPRGDEVYLTQDLVFEDIASIVIDTCCEGGDCRDLDAVGAPGVVQPVRAWVVARPAALDGGPRPSVPEGCGHPGNAMHPSRRCGGVRIEILCAIPPPHADPLLDLAALHDAVCGPWGAALPAEVSDEANLVVLGAVEVVPEGVYATPLNRRLIPRLDQLGRMVCALHDPAIKYVTHIQHDREDADRAIDKLLGFDAAGQLFVETLDQAIASVEAGTSYETLPPAHDGRKLLVRRRRSRKYLQTEGDGQPPNDLLSLPEIRDS